MPTPESVPPSPPAGRPRRLWGTLIFLLLVALMSGALFFLSQHPEPRPDIPDDEDHRSPFWSDCLACHGEGQAEALKPNHPLKRDDCFRCHPRSRGR